MQVSLELNELFAKYNHKLIEEFCNSFAIKFFLMHASNPGNGMYHVLPEDVDENEFCYYFYNEEHDYICAIYRQTEKEIAEKFQRFLKIRVFL